MDDEEIESKMSELELQIEEHERTESVLYGVAFCFLFQIIWSIWVASIIGGLVVSFIHWKFIAKKPFSSAVSTTGGSK